MTRPTATLNRLILQPPGADDPRLALDERALVIASRNSFPLVAQARSRHDAFGLAVGSGVALLLGGLTFWSMSGHRTPPPALGSPAAVRSTPPALPPTSVGQPLVPPPTGSLMMPSVRSVAFPPAVEPARAPVMVFDATSIPAPAQASVTSSAPAAAAGHGVPVAAGASDNEQFANRAGDSEVQVATAQALANPADTVTQGTLIPAVLETAIDTDLPGYVRALVSRDVRSFDSSQVLIPRSSRLIGQYKSGLAAGQTRAYVIWTRLIRPDGASVALGSPGVDLAGNSGLAGKVDGHFMKRFGSAVLLSVVGGLTAAGNAAVVLSGGQSAASVAAQRDTSIPPTIRVAQGQPIRIFTARDLDFSTVAPVVASR